MAVQRRSPSNLTGSAEKNSRKSQKSRCAKLVASYPRRLEAVIAAKGASTKYCVKGLNTYVNVIFQFFFFNKCVKISKILFSFCHYRVLSVD